MSELDRRLLLAGAGLAGVAALGRLAKAGPLDPPPGPVAPTGKTLTEVYDKIARSDAGFAEPRIPVESLPTDENGTRTITQTGSYYLTTNLEPSGGGSAIRVGASDVTLDLCGFRINQPASACIEVLNDNVTIRNGSLISTGTLWWAIKVSVPVKRLVVEDMIITAKSVGVGGTSVGYIERCSIRRCLFRVIGGADSNTLYLGDDAEVRDCHVETGLAYGITVGKRARIFDCSIVNVTEQWNTCITAGDGSRISRLSVEYRHGSVGFSGCIRTGNHCHISDCVFSPTDSFASTNSHVISTGSNCVVSGCVMSVVRRGILLGPDSTCRECSLLGGREPIVAADRCVVTDCQIRSMPLESSPPTAVTLGSDCIAIRNSILNAEGGTGIRVVGQRNRIEANTVRGCLVGISSMEASTFVACNQCSGNTTDYSLAPGTKAGPIVSSPADPNGSHPWANFAT